MINSSLLPTVKLMPGRQFLSYSTRKKEWGETISSVANEIAFCRHSTSFHWRWKDDAQKSFQIRLWKMKAHSETWSFLNEFRGEGERKDLNSPQLGKVKILTCCTGQYPGAKYVQTGHEVSPHRQSLPGSMSICNRSIPVRTQIKLVSKEGRSPQWGVGEGKGCGEKVCASIYGCRVAVPRDLLAPTTCSSSLSDSWDSRGENGKRKPLITMH